MSESATKWIVVGALLLVVLTYVALMKRGERRRELSFDLLASSVGVSVDRTDQSARFSVKVDDRDVEVRDEYRGGGMGASGSGTRYISVVTPLRGRSWDLHSVEIRRRLRLRSAAQSFDETYAVEEFGLPMGEGWVTRDVRSAVEAFFAVADSYGRISIEQGKLMYRVPGSPRSIAVDTMKSLIGVFARLAAAIEHAR